MAKDSDKRAVLAKRTAELAHAVNHEFSDVIIGKRLEKLRFAALKLIKKEANIFENRSQYYSELSETWNSLSHADIIKIVELWPDNPSIRDLDRDLTQQ